MTSSGELAFRANARIKDIIGRGLILDDNIAIIELIKNSKDASSPNVKLHFKEQTGTSSSELILKDFGLGMTIDDIKEKWLNIAYSEKKAANSGRDKPFAGSKGVGRFSCDRLGEKLTLYTKSKRGDYIKLPIDWVLFETGSKDAEISTIKLQFEILSENDFLTEIGESVYISGTILKISKLRATWGNRKLHNLKSELEKFISDPESNFEVALKIYDAPEIAIKNTVFEELALRTYNIVSSIDATGEKLVTELLYHGEPVYSYEVGNPYTLLKSIKVSIHYMNFSSKLFFNKKTGYTTNDYGSVFLFLNGFRVSPYGNPRNDWLGLDQRKTQGTSRNLGTRDVIGQVSVTDHADLFKPISSREGLENDEAYHELTASDPDGNNKVRLRNNQLDYGFVPHIIRQLERFIVEGLNWHSLMDLSNPARTNIPEKDVRADPHKFGIRTVDQNTVKEAIDRTLRTSSFEIKTFKVNERLIAQLAEEADDAYNEYVLSFIQNTTGKSFDELTSVDKGNFKKIALRNMEAIRAEKQAQIEALEQRQRAEKAEHKAEQERLRAEEAEKLAADAKSKQRIAETTAANFERTAKVEKKRRLFAEASQIPDSKKNLELIHHIRILGEEISGDLNEALDALAATTDTALVESKIKSALFHNEKLLNLAKVVSNAGFDMLSDKLTEDIFSFTSQYLEQLGDLSRSFKLSVSFENPSGVEFLLPFSPIEVTMLIDNIMANASTAESHKLIVLAKETADFIDLIFENDGNPLTKRYTPDELFHRGITTTTGSGVGLSQVKRIASALAAEVSIFNNESNGVSVRMRWPK
jgi:signal transduction histidine kinase